MKSVFLKSLSPRNTLTIPVATWAPSCWGAEHFRWSDLLKLHCQMRNLAVRSSGSPSDNLIWHCPFLQTLYPDFIISPSKLAPASDYGSLVITPLPGLGVWIARPGVIRRSLTWYAYGLIRFFFFFFCHYGGPWFNPICSTCMQFPYSGFIGHQWTSNGNV